MLSYTGMTKPDTLRIILILQHEQKIKKPTMCIKRHMMGSWLVTDVLPEIKIYTGKSIETMIRFIFSATWLL